MACKARIKPEGGTEESSLFAAVGFRTPRLGNEKKSVSENVAKGLIEIRKNPGSVPDIAEVATFVPECGDNFRELGHNALAKLWIVLVLALEIQIVEDFAQLAYQALE